MSRTHLNTNAFLTKKTNYPDLNKEQDKQLIYYAVDERRSRWTGAILHPLDWASKIKGRTQFPMRRDPKMCYWVPIVIFRPIWLQFALYVIVVFWFLFFRLTVQFLDKSFALEV